MTRYSQNGWPVLSKDQTQVIHVAGGFFRVAPVEGMATVFTELIRRFDAEVEPIAGAVLDDWSWADRPVRGSTTVTSNHASGTAVDLNALKHPRGTTGTFTTAQMAAIRRILKAIPCIKWGGDFHTVPDPMHWEVDGGAFDVHAAAVKIRADHQEDDMPTADEIVTALLGHELQTGWQDDGTFDPAKPVKRTIGQLLTETRGEVLAVKAALKPPAA